MIKSIISGKKNYFLNGFCIGDRADIILLFIIVKKITTDLPSARIYLLKSGKQDSSPFHFVPEDEAPSPGETDVDAGLLDCPTCLKFLCCICSPL